MDNENSNFLNEVRAMIGKTVNTVWGPCTVQKVSKDSKGNWHVHLLEFGVEPFAIQLSDWSASLQ